MTKSVDESIAPFDAVVAPSSKMVATPIDQEFHTSYTSTAKDPMGAIGNGAGLPSISVLAGFTSSGLPLGIQFMGRAYKENTIIAVAKAYQSITEWHK